MGTAVDSRGSAWNDVGEYTLRWLPSWRAYAVLRKGAPAIVGLVVLELRPLPGNPDGLPFHKVSVRFA